MWIMIAATEDDMDEHVAPSVLSGIKEKLEVTDLIKGLPSWEASILETMHSFFIQFHYE